MLPLHSPKAINENKQRHKTLWNFSSINLTPLYHSPNCTIYTKLQKNTNSPKLQSTFSWQQHGQGTALDQLSKDKTCLQQLIKPESQRSALNRDSLYREHPTAGPLTIILSLHAYITHDLPTAKAGGIVG